MLEAKKDSVLQEDLEIIAFSNVDWNLLDGSTILVTGATGLIGSQIIKALACRNRICNASIKILACVRNMEKAKVVFADILERAELKIIEGDVTKIFDIKENVDYLIHTASATASKEFVTKPVEVIQTAINGTQNFLELAKNKNAKGAVYLSSMEAFGVVQASDKKAEEKDLGFIDLENVRSCYPESKRLSECLCTAYASEYNVPIKVARLSQTFGAGIHYSENRVFAQFAKSALEKRDIILHTTGMSYGNYCYTRDTIIGILLLLTRGCAGEAYTISNEESNVRIKDMAQMVAKKLADNNIKVVFDVPESSLTYGYAPDTELHLSSAKMQNLGWKPTVNLEESYRRLMRSMLCTKE